MFGRLFQNVQEGIAAHGAVDTAIGRGRVAFHRQKVLAAMLAHGLPADLLHLESGGRLECVVIVQGDHVKHDVLGYRVR